MVSCIFLDNHMFFGLKHSGKHLYSCHIHNFGFILDKENLLKAGAVYRETTRYGPVTKDRRWIYMIYYLQYGNGPERQVVKLKDELFGHLPWKPLSAEVAVCGCLLVDGPLQIQFPSEETEEKKFRGGNPYRSYLFMVSMRHDHIMCLFLSLPWFNLS